MIDFKQEIAALICTAGNGAFDKQAISDMIEIPPDEVMGDYSLPCFKLSKIMRKSPALISEGLSKAMPPSDLISKSESIAGYLNFKINYEIFAKSVLSEIISKGEIYGADDLGSGKTVVIDYSAPNIAKPFHIGHLSTTVIGAALYRIYSYSGYKCVGINHLGDWGTQFGKMITAYKKWGDKKVVEKEKLIKEFSRIYARYHIEVEKHPELDDEARAWFSKMEAGDPEALEYWRWFKEISMIEFEKVYSMLGITFDSYDGESFYNDKMQAVVDKLRQSGLLEESDGALIVRLDAYGMPPCLIVKSDGSSLYATRDIAAAIYRKETYGFEKCLYVTGTTQNLHFRQWFKVLELMGFEWAKDLLHIGFGTIDFEGVKIATRAGNMILLEEIFEKSVSKTKEIIEKKNPDLKDKDRIAEQIGIGAVVFNNLSSGRIKDISFSWEDALNFDGETGPYVQYAHARANSVLVKANANTEYIFDASLLKNPEEIRLVKILYDFPSQIKTAMNENEPSVITRLSVDLAQQFNKFYNNLPIISDDRELMKARLALTYSVRTVLKITLRLIGLAAPEKV